MTPIFRTVSVLLTLAAAGLDDLRADESRNLVPPLPDANQPRVVGVASCSATNCHGGRNTFGGEYTHWATLDKAHRQAYDVLLSDVSVQMARKLGIAAAHHDARCLACHSMQAAVVGHVSNVPGIGRQVENLPHNYSHEFGVGCESCHGPAREWLSRHTQRSWRSLSREDKHALGFRDLKSLTARADTCIACHVGSPAATVDHDLIAAGHPRLLFELGSYHSQLPKHWNEAAAIQRDPVQDLRLWAIGQATSARAVADLATARATTATRTGDKFVAADLAEFDCHACHHDLTDQDWRGRSVSQGGLGLPQWGTWNFRPASVSVREVQSALGSQNRSADAALEAYLQLMQASRLGLVPADKLNIAARNVSTQLTPVGHSIETVHCDLSRVRDVWQRLASQDATNLWPANWEGQTQRYLALIAVDQTLRGLSDPANNRPPVDEAKFAPLRIQLIFPAGYATPVRYQPQAVQQLFHELHR